MTRPYLTIVRTESVDIDAWAAEHIQAEPPSRLERFLDASSREFVRVLNFLAHTFGETPRGFTFFVGLLFPLAIAAFCAGYFGVRMLAVML